MPILVSLVRISLFSGVNGTYNALVSGFDPADDSLEFIGEDVLDQTATRFGIRTIAFDAERGFELNGQPVRFKGVCLHHDLGALGAAVNRRATERQLEIMKAMGANAIRTSHNPPSPEQLDLADELGLLVMDEAFDMWGRTKIENGHGKYFVF